VERKFNNLSINCTKKDGRIMTVIVIDGEIYSENSEYISFSHDSKSDYVKLLLTHTEKFNLADSQEKR
jgi:hypothetical protein